MNIKKIALIIVLSSASVLTAQKFVKEKKASNASRQECAQHIAEQIKVCAQLIEDLAKTQQLLLEETVAFLENNPDAVLIKIGGKNDLATLQNSIQDLTNTMCALDKKVKSNMVNIESKKVIVTA